MKELFWATIQYIYMDEEKGYMVFINRWGDKHYAYSADGDCCSHSWFESVTNQENIIGEKIIGMEEKPEVEDESSSEGECIRVYGYTLKTAVGYTDIEFRNSSNGYYGGSCIFLRDTKLRFPQTQTERPKHRFVTLYGGIKVATKVPDSDILKNTLPIFMTIGDSKTEIKLFPYVDGKLLWTS